MKKAKTFEHVVGVFTMDRKLSATKQEIRGQVRATLNKLGKVRKVECFGPMK